MRLAIVLTALIAVAACKKDPAPSAPAAPAAKEGATKKAPSGPAADYAAKAKTTEAQLELDKIMKSAAMYYETPHVSRDGMMLPCQFPESVDWTPAGDPCKGEGKRFPASADAWSAATWSALVFMLQEPHYYRYKVESSGELGAAKLTAYAAGDLDCDGVWSTFTRVLAADPETTRSDCRAGTAGVIQVDNELE